MKKFTVFFSCLFVLLSFSNVFALDKVSIMMEWFPVEPSYVVMATGVQKGFFKEEGIDLEIVVSRGGVLTAQTVAAGKVNFGIVTTMPLLIARSQGLPLVSVFQLSQKTPHALFCRKDRNVNTLQDLTGKSTIYTPVGTRGFMLMAFLRTNNIEDKMILLGGNNATDTMEVQMFLSGKIDCIVGSYYMTVPRIENKVEYTSFSFSDYGFKIPFGNIVVTEETIQKNPNLIRRFNRALLKACIYARKNVDEAVSYHKLMYPDVNTNDVKEYYVRMAPFMYPEKTGGKVDVDGLKFGYEYLKKTKQLQSDFDIEKSYSNGYLK